ncbi:MAG TPA: hypothetical protein PKD24_03955 [Pyrinomonadaceae bacterium]|nr:hypothetical protein [Pyrinomonadaceae bacterium]HMP64704.1 hypothetical protein [Pyrinomonadaceae bacterium]
MTTRNGGGSTSRSYAVRLDPNETYDFDLDLSYFYELDAGEYSLIVRRPVFGKDRMTVLTAQLKPTLITIIE